MASRVRLSDGRVAWWAEIPLRWRIVWTVSPYVPLPWLIRGAIRASVDACHRWLGA